ncbi:MAG: hypothetical protein LBI91_01425 [Spirochaetaceae bacterium]|jgi:hypothetical protein|nr:hypothetical protein [Spirochaetaceae bacterium]
MSSISIKQTKIHLFKIIRLIPPALPAFIALLFAARWQPFSDAALFPGAAFQNETTAGLSDIRKDAGYGEIPKIKNVSEWPRPDLPAKTAPPGEIAGAFYRAARENAESARKPGPSRNRPAPGENTGPPEPEPASGPENDPGEQGGAEGWRLLGFIRDTGGVERRYFKEDESGRIVVLTGTQEFYPANAGTAGREGASTP